MKESGNDSSTWRRWGLKGFHSSTLTWYTTKAEGETVIGGHLISTHSYRQIHSPFPNALHGYF